MGERHDDRAARAQTARCAPVRAALGEPLHGSAPPATRAWLLIEHPGPWPAPPEQVLPPEAAATWEAAVAAGVRPQLIRTTRARRRTHPRVFLAAARDDTGWLQRRDLGDLRELGDLSTADLRAAAAGRDSGFGTEVDAPILLVCTHGRHDPCCARTGRPVAETLTDTIGTAVFETTHVGGHRFAATMVALPHGTYHGDVDPDSATRVGTAALRGQVVLAHYRGRAGLPAAVQSAEWFARRATGTLELAAVQVRRWHPADRHTTVVDLLVDSTPVRVTVAGAPARHPRITSCGDASEATPTHHRLVAIDAAGLPVDGTAGPGLRSRAG